jgi:hypothetical protein
MRLIPRPIRDAIQRITQGRSGKWPGVRNRFLDRHPVCAACGQRRRRDLNVHHIIPFSQDPSRELDENNLITLCETGGKLGMNCHLVVGHLGRWDACNPHVEQDAELWARRLRERRP